MLDDMSSLPRRCDGRGVKRASLPRDLAVRRRLRECLSGDAPAGGELGELVFEGGFGLGWFRGRFAAEAGVAWRGGGAGVSAGL
jgi:hypothetical protein